MKWTELVTAIDGKLPIVARGDDWVGLRWPSHQSQRIQLVDSRSAGLLVLVVCELGPTAIADSARLLELNMTMRLGAAALYRGRCVLRYVVTLAGVDAGAFVDAAKYLADTAARIGRAFVGQGMVHEHFAE